MEEVELEALRAKALSLHAKGYKWHFHILSPDCTLNNKPLYAFILECPSEQLVLVHYSDKIEMDLRNELVPLLHGKDVLKETLTQPSYTPSDTVKKIVRRAKDLNKQHIEWHHHMLFPDCIFNTKTPHWILMFEDKQNNEVLESLSDEEPVNDLKQIEPLF